MTWRLAKSIVVLRDEVNAMFPNRDKSSDGTIGDANHLAEGWTLSDHNPWVLDSKGVGVVRAVDIDSGPGLNPSDTLDVVGDTVADRVRLAGATGHPALQSGGYVISEGRIASARSNPPWSWRAYGGSDPHESHVHISVGTYPAAYDSVRAWNLKTQVTQNPDGGPWGPFPIAATHAFGPRSPGSQTWHDGRCHRSCLSAVIEIRNEVGDTRRGSWYDIVLLEKVRAWQQYVHDHGTPGIPVDGVVRKVTWDAMTRR